MTKNTTIQKIFPSSPSLIDLSNSDWKTKKSECYDEVSDHWNELLNKLSENKKFYGIVHGFPVRTEVEFKGYIYSINTIKSTFLKEDHKLGESYSSTMVMSETEDTLITGNFLDENTAIMWIESILDN